MTACSTSGGVVGLLSRIPITMGSVSTFSGAAFFLAAGGGAAFGASLSPNGSTAGSWATKHVATRTHNNIAIGGNRAWRVMVLVIGHWSLVIGHWSLVIGHWSLVIGQRAGSNRYTND